VRALVRLVRTEARVTLARLHRDGQLDRSQYLTTLDAVASYWETQVQVLEWTEEVFRSAEHLAETQPGLRTLDALHVGAARTQRLGSRPEAMAFISCDLRLLKAAAIAWARAGDRLKPLDLPPISTAACSRRSGGASACATTRRGRPSCHAAIHPQSGSSSSTTTRR